MKNLTLKTALFLALGSMIIGASLAIFATTSSAYDGNSGKSSSIQGNSLSERLQYSLENNFGFPKSK